MGTETVTSLAKAEDGEGLKLHIKVCTPSPSIFNVTQGSIEPACQKTPTGSLLPGSGKPGPAPADHPVCRLRPL